MTLVMQDGVLRAVAAPAPVLLAPVSPVPASPVKVSLQPVAVPAPVLLAPAATSFAPTSLTPARGSSAALVQVHSARPASPTPARGSDEIARASSVQPKKSDALVRVRSSSARRPTRRRRPSPEELEAHYRELEAFKKEEERRKKEAEKEFKKQAIQDKKNVQRALQQASKEANSKDNEIQRLLRNLERIEAEQERQSARKFAQQQRLDENLRKLREDRSTVELQYEGKLAEAGEARGRLDLMDGLLRQKEKDEEPEDQLSEEEIAQRAQQELLKADIAQTRMRIQALANTNSRSRQELREMRQNAALWRQKAGEDQHSASSQVLPSSPNAVLGASGTIAAPQGMASNSSAAAPGSSRAASFVNAAPARAWSTAILEGRSAAQPSGRSPQSVLAPAISSSGTSTWPFTVPVPAGGAAFGPAVVGSHMPLLAPASAGPLSLAKSQPQLMQTPQGTARPQSSRAVPGSAIAPRREAVPPASAANGVHAKAHEKWNHLRDATFRRSYSEEGLMHPPVDGLELQGNGLYSVVKEVTAEALRQYRQAGPKAKVFEW